MTDRPATNDRLPSNSGLILAMDGSTGISAAALLAGDAAQPWGVLARRADKDSRGQARVLLRHVDDMLREARRQPADIAAIVVGVGPGTFTGVRIAVATARALALALPCPVVGVSTLSALAAELVSRLERHGGDEPPDLMVPVVDARRGQVFYGIYRVSRGEGRQEAGAGRTPLASPTGGRLPAGASYIREEPFSVCDRAELAARIRGSVGRESRVWIAGEVEGLAAGGVAGEDSAGPMNYLSLDVSAEHLVSGQSRLQAPGETIEGARLALWVEEVVDGRATIARQACRVGDPGSPEAVKPIYIRSPDADIHITKMKDPWAHPGMEG